MTITFTKAGDETYYATDGVRSCVVQKAWYRTGGWQWRSDVPQGLATVRGASRKECAEKALRVLAARA
jgi:hypothetical protein